MFFTLLSLGFQPYYLLIVKYTCDPVLPNPENGKYLPNTASLVGTELATICDHGYHPNSTETVQCDEDGEDAVWVGNPPICGT